MNNSMIGMKRVKKRVIGSRMMCKNSFRATEASRWIVPGKSIMQIYAARRNKAISLDERDFIKCSCGAGFQFALEKAGKLPLELTASPPITVDTGCDLAESTGNTIRFFLRGI